MTTTTALNSTDVATLWRIARRLYPIYTELDRTFELGAASCADLEQKDDRQRQGGEARRALVEIIQGIGLAAFES